MVRSCVIAIVVGSLSACSANPPSEEIPTPLGWDEASGRLQTALEESRSMGSNWVIDVEDCRLTITQIRRRMYTYPNAIETTITRIPLQEVVNIQPDVDHRLIRVWTSKNAITITVDNTDAAPERRYDSVYTIPFPYRDRDFLPDVQDALAESPYLCCAAVEVRRS